MIAADIDKRCPPVSIRITTDPHRQVNKVCRNCPKDAKLWLIVERDESGVQPWAGAEQGPRRGWIIPGEEP